MAGQRVISAVLTLKDKNFASGVSKAASSTKDMERKVKATGNSIREFSRNATSNLKTLGGAVAAVFAVDKIKDFTVSIVESAAEANALSSQFDQVFGADAGEARGVVENLGKSFGMLPNRIKPAFTSATSMFKGLGLETGDAMDVANRSITAVADAAAFYDKSFEDANSSLNSFIKGNYEGGEAIGLFANESQLAGYASRELGVDWKKLGEADKQIARLSYAEKMMEAAGATGQALRESDSYENQLGNMKQSWTDLKAGLGQAVLEPAITGIKKLTGFIQGIDTEVVVSKVKAFGGFMKDTFGPVLQSVKDGVMNFWNSFKEAGGIEAAKGILDGFKGTLVWIKDNAVQITAGLAGVYGGIAAFKIISGITAAVKGFNTIMLAMRTGTLLQTAAQWGLNTALLASPLTWIAVGIGAVIAAGVLLWKNWDTVKEKAQVLWTVTKSVFGAFTDWMGEKIQPVIGFFSDLKAKWDDFKAAISKFKPPAWLSKIGGAIGGAASKVKGWIDGSHATGLNRVPRDGYVAELHKGEMVVPASQSENLRKQGRNISNVDKQVTVNVPSQYNGSKSAPIIKVYIQGYNKSVTEIVNEMVPLLKLRLQNL